jgi:hypothetical protein
MTPEELAKYRADKLEKEKASEEARKADVSARRDRILSQNSAAELALEEIIIYLDQVKIAMSPSFSYKPFRDTSNRIAGFDLTLGAVTVEMRKDTSGSISASTRDTNRERKAFTFIRSASDLTEDNLSRLVKAMIDN